MGFNFPEDTKKLAKKKKKKDNLFCSFYWGCVRKTDAIHLVGIEIIKCLWNTNVSGLLREH